jgi:hypothetical protein
VKYGGMDDRVYLRRKRFDEMDVIVIYGGE